MMMKTLIGLILITATMLCASGQTPHKVYPSATDANINTYTSSQNYCYAPTGTAKNKLLVFLPGTLAQPSGCEQWMVTAAQQGFHVVGLEYPNAGIDTQYDTLSGYDWINSYAYEHIFGIDRTPIVSINYSNCIQNRLVKCLQWLHAHFPAEGWSQYYTGDSLNWGMFTITGHSLGGNFAACIGKFEHVDRVICVSSPRVVPFTDWGTFATSTSNYHFFWHYLDLASGFRDEDSIIHDMGIFDPVVVTDTTPSSSWGHVLKTTYKCPPSRAHKIVISDNVTPIVGGVPYYKPVWIYLMTH